MLRVDAKQAAYQERDEDRRGFPDSDCHGAHLHFDARLCKHASEGEGYGPTLRRRGWPVAALSGHGSAVSVPAPGLRCPSGNQ